MTRSTCFEPARFNVELFVADRRQRIIWHRAVRNGCMIETGRSFSFELCHKRADFDGVKLDQVWMHVGSIYGKAGVRVRNHDVLVEHYWAQCMRDGTDWEEGPIESYVLAKLLPYTRWNGARNIFDDAILTSKPISGVTHQQQINNLDAMLADSLTEAIDMETFHTQTNKEIGLRVLKKSVQAQYDDLVNDLLEKGRCTFQRWGAPGLQVPIAKLKRWMETWVRRSGNKDRKLALDILSYECRAALRRCYSAVWRSLMDHLQTKFGYDEQWRCLHMLLHRDIDFPSDSPNARFHLFHGHIFGLHPAVSRFMQTKSGRMLIGNFLRVEVGDLPFRRLLHGLSVAICDYARLGKEQTADRKKVGLDSRVRKIVQARRSQLDRQLFAAKSAQQCPLD